MGFEVGQVVVCADASRLPQDIGTLPKEGGVYTVRAVRSAINAMGLLLAEIVNPQFEDQRQRWRGGVRGPAVPACEDQEPGRADADLGATRDRPA